MSIENIDKNKCCGCAACVESCPQKCISYKIDAEGFFYPDIDKKKCIDCNICEKVCPINNNNLSDCKNNTYIAYSKSENAKLNSSSGGIFVLLAEKVIEQGGTVFGAAFDKEFNLHHIRVTSKKELKRLLRSKYIQSNILDIYRELLQDLNDKKMVLFCGTPCQVSAIKSKMTNKKLLDNLILIDFICHGVPSPGIWNSYKIYLEEKLKDKIKDVNFRDKSKGWHDYSFYVSTENKTICESHDLNAYMRTFLSDKNIRPSCYNCFVKPDNYQSDITLGDAWKIEKEKADWADDKGTSVIITRTDKGEEYLERIKDEIHIASSSYEKWCQFNPSLSVRTNINIDRENFFNKFAELSRDEFWKKNEKINWKIKIKYRLKKTIKLFNLDKIIRKMYK